MSWLQDGGERSPQSPPSAESASQLTIAQLGQRSQGCNSSNVDGGSNKPSDNRLQRARSMIFSASTTVVAFHLVTIIGPRDSDLVHCHVQRISIPIPPFPSVSPAQPLPHLTSQSAIMAATFARTFRARPYLTSAAFTGIVGAAYYSTIQRPVLLDSAQNATQTFSFPKTMLFSQQLTVTGVEQVNHDTKRITFSLPGGKEETTGVPASGTPRENSRHSQD